MAPPLPNSAHGDQLMSAKPRGTARFRRFELVSVCGLWQWRLHSCLLSPRAFFGVSFLMCALRSVRMAAADRREGSRPRASVAARAPHFSSRLFFEDLQRDVCHVESTYLFWRMRPCLPSSSTGVV